MSLTGGQNQRLQRWDCSELLDQGDHFKGTAQVCTLADPERHFESCISVLLVRLFMGARNLPGVFCNNTAFRDEIAIVFVILNGCMQDTYST